MAVPGRGEFVDRLGGGRGVEGRIERLCLAGAEKGLRQWPGRAGEADDTDAPLTDEAG